MKNLQNHWLNNSIIAHRGLHDDKYPENSMGAFLAGMQAGFPIEIDVHLTQDGKVVVFHDHDIKRICGKEGEIEKMTYEEIEKLRLCGSEYKIPLLSELVAVATTPILCELKNLTKNIGPLESETLKILEESGVQFAIQSFNPYSIIWYKQNAPHVVRGQLSSFYDGEKVCLKKRMLKAMWFNRKSKPNFISYDQQNMPNKFVTKYCNKNKSALKLTWTVKSQERQDQLAPHVDGIIFDEYLPNSNKVK